MTKGILREVSYEIDKFEMEHYNEDKKGMFEQVQRFLDEINDETVDLETKKHIDPERISGGIQESLMEARVHIDEMESIAVQNGLVRSKHLQNLLQAARCRGSSYHHPDIDHVQVKLPWYLVNNLLEKLYLKYHKTKIHKCFDKVHKYLLDEDNDSYRGIYCFWKEIEELWDEVFDEETLSNHYHDDDDYWEYDIDPKECKNKKDFFRKRVRAKVQEKEDQKRMVQEEAQRKKKQAVELLRNRVHKLKRYTSLKEYGEKVKGSVYWMIDVARKYAKDKYGMLYAGESKNFHRRYTAYEPRANGNVTELEKKFKKKLPHISDAEIRNFVRDPEACKLKVITNTRLSNANYRLAWERRIIKRFQPLLNLK